MGMILLLVLFTILRLGSTSNEVLIMKFIKCLDESPVSITIKANSDLEEFTFCAKYNFRFLRESLLMGFDQDQERHFGSNIRGATTNDKNQNFQKNWVPIK